MIRTDERTVSVTHVFPDQNCVDPHTPRQLRDQGRVQPQPVVQDLCEQGRIVKDDVGEAFVAEQVPGMPEDAANR